MFDWFDLNPHHLANAALQQWVMLFVAGTLGFIIAYVSRQGTINRLEGMLAGTTRMLADYTRTLPDSGTAIVDDNVILQRIQSRASELDFTHLGTASPDDADDLKAIVGISPFLEKKLHAIGIYTFSQIARFTPEDVERVNDIIEFFPGRIEHDNWVGQSARLARPH